MHSGSFLAIHGATAEMFLANAALGAIVLAGHVVAYVVYREVYVSVWCFFAVAASFVILYHFECSCRHSTPIAGSTG